MPSELTIKNVEEIALKNNLNVWDFLPGFDTKKSYEAFLVYLNMGKDRALRATAKLLNKSFTLIGQWSGKYLWNDRAIAHDFSLEKEKIQLTRQTDINSHKNELSVYRNKLKDLGWQNLAIAQECFDVGFQYITKFKQNPEALETMRPIDFKNIMNAGNECGDQALKTLSEALAVGKLLEQLEQDDGSIEVEAEVLNE